LALGANLLNMALLGPVSGYGVYWLVRRLSRGTRGLVLAAAFAAWCSVVCAAISCAGQLAWSGVARWSVVFPAMANTHMLIGVGEGLITGLVLVAIARMRPELIAADTGPHPASSYGELVVYGLLLALSLAVFVAPFASPWPDGLEKVAVSLGFADRLAAPPLRTAPLPEYGLPGRPSTAGITAWAGAIGTVVAFGLAWLLARWLVPVPVAKPDRSTGRVFVKPAE
jgi:cobalt/nickel transport system permease protein